MIAVSISCQVLLTFWKKEEERRQLWQRISWLCLCLPLRTENGKWNDHSCIFFYYINANLVYLLKMCYTVYYYIVFKFNNNHNALFKYTCVFQNDRDCWGKSRWLGEMPYGPTLSSHQASIIGLSPDLPKYPVLASETLWSGLAVPLQRGPWSSIIDL